MKSSRNGKNWGVKARLDEFDRKGLVGLVRDLYEASAVNRRFLEARLLNSPSALEQYRLLVSEAVYPDPFSRNPIRLRDASAAITEYRRSTGNLTGAVDLMLTFIEAGTEQAADLGYGDDNYFGALERKVDDVINAFPTLPSDDQARAATRLVQIRDAARHIGWGYGDYVDDAVGRLPVAFQAVASRNGDAV
jgi:hypothetical protein